MKAAWAFALSLMIASATFAHADSLPPDLAFLVNRACEHCHDGHSSNPLNLADLQYDLNDADTFRSWERVFDRITAGEMPPASEPRPDSDLLKRSLRKLKADLRAANLAQQARRGRVPVRRLSRVEYQHSISDLFSLHGNFVEALPGELSSGKFDTQASGQHFSSLHLQAYLATADRVVDSAMRLYANPHRTYEFDLKGNAHLNSFHDRELRIGGNISRKLDDGVAIFRDVDYLLRSDLHGFKVKSNGAGRYRISVVAKAFQSETPVAMKVVVKDVNGQSELVGCVDLLSDDTTEFEVEVNLARTKVFYVSMAEERHAARILGDILDAGGAHRYAGPGIAVQSIRVEGPLADEWPTTATRMLLPDVAFVKDSTDDKLQLELAFPAIAHVRRMLENVTPRLFRRSVAPEELDTFVRLAEAAIDEGRELPDVVRVVLRAVLTSPDFLFISAPPGHPDDLTLASRLSYFLWKSAPDETLIAFAEQQKLSNPQVLAGQVERLLNDEKSARFVADFCGQWLRLNELEATTPDEKLYPEYDEVLHWSVRQETQRFFAEVLAENLSVATFIDSDFTFLNRRLAQHYGIDGIVGQDLRRVTLPEDSMRGGLLTHASVLKVTANGFVTSPVTRGDFVLSDFFGTPLPPPPAGVGSIEPDTSGATTIRDVLAKHRTVPECARCHDRLDPPGFAMECFDPIGGLRTHYRIQFEELLSLAHYKDGPKVDASGMTDDGRAFRDIAEYKSLVMSQQRQLARHLIGLLVSYATGGELQFADREEVERILQETEKDGFPMRSIVHKVVQSSLFRRL